MKLEVLDDAAAVAHAVAERFVNAAVESVAAHGSFRVALAGGSTPKAAYRLLAEPPFRPRVDWSRVEVFFGDERCVPPDHADSNYRMASEALLQKVAIPPEKVHRMQGEAAPEDAAATYAAALAGLGRPLDLVLLGMGADGHTASLFPETTALAAEEPAVAVYVPKLEAWRVTMSAPFLSAAARVVVSTVGGEKAEALKLALEGPPGAVPIQLVRAADLTWIVDRAAASLVIK
jgi:6-phosphogluconolactonase